MSALNPAHITKRRDFLNVHNNLDFKKTNDKLEPKYAYNGNCFSDYVFVYDKKLKKKRMCIIVTQDSISLHHLNGFKRLTKMPLTDLTTVSLSAKNCNMCCFHFAKGADLLMESYRRIEIILYCARNVKEAGSQLFKLTIRKNFKGSAAEEKDKTAPLKDVPLKELERHKKDFEASFLKDTIRNAKKSGYLKLHKKGVFSSSFNEHFFILSEIGFIFFKKYGVTEKLTIGQEIPGLYPCDRRRSEGIPKGDLWEG